MLNEIECYQIMTRAWVEAWVDEHKKPDWLEWLGLYPAKASVDAAEATLKAMNENKLYVSTREYFEIFTT